MRSQVNHSVEQSKVVSVKFITRWVEGLGLAKATQVSGEGAIRVKGEHSAPILASSSLTELLGHCSVLLVSIGFQ